MAHIVTDVESNPKLKEIYQILLLAGYFRIRIGSLKPFDKIIGGLAWCISCSNFEIDVEYNDEMQIGQKIKVGQKICDALKNMKCPYSILPFQLQGLDLNAIYPLIQWLIKFVYETRQARQKFNTRLSSTLSENIIKRQLQIQPHEILIEAKRIKKNAQIQKVNKHDPLRVYSTLLEFGDVTSSSAYNKLCAIAGGKVNKDKKSDSKKGPLTDKNQKTNQGQFDLSSYLFESAQQTSEGNIKAMTEVSTEQRKKFKQIERKMMISGQQLQKIVVENREKIQQALKQNQDQQQQSPQAKLTKTLQAENEAFESQKKLLQQKAKALQSKQNRLNKKINEIRSILAQQEEKVVEEQGEYERYQQAKKQFQQELQQRKVNQKQTKKLQKLVQQRAKLKSKKQQLKRNALAQIQQLKKTKQKAVQNIPQIDQQVYEKMMNEIKKKKKIKDEKMLELAELNQQMAVFQRKIQKITSPPQIAQYQKRLAEIYESINLQIEDKKYLMSKIGQQKGVSKIASDYLSLISNFKQNYINSKSKSQKKDFISSLQATMSALQANQKSGQTILKSVQQTKKWIANECNTLIKYEKEYFALRKKLLQMQIAQEQYQ